MAPPPRRRGEGTALAAPEAETQAGGRAGPRAATVRAGGPAPRVRGLAGLPRSHSASLGTICWHLLSFDLLSAVRFKDSDPGGLERRVSCSGNSTCPTDGTR